MKGSPRRRNLKRLGMISVPGEPDLSLEMRRQLVADFCKLVAARQGVARRSTKVDADLSVGKRDAFDASAVRPRRRSTLPFHGNVAASFSPVVADTRRQAPADRELTAKAAATARADGDAVAAAGRADQTVADDKGRALSPRLLQTLDGLLRGDSEKQIALKLLISKHTVHAYVKTLYRRYGANSRGELLARWVKR